MNDQLHTPAAARLGGPKNWSGNSEEQINVLDLSEVEPQIIQPVAYLPY